MRKLNFVLVFVLTLAIIANGQSRVVQVKTREEFVAAIPSNDEIILFDGVAFVGNFKMPPKTTPTLIRAATSIAPGTRAVGTHAPSMPKIITPNADPAIELLDGADNYKFVGIDFTVAPGVATNYGVVRLGTGQETSLDQLPANTTFERVLIHGNATGDMKRGLEANGRNVTVIDSSIYEIHVVGQETQAFAMWNGTGAKIINNYLEAAGINVLIGGADPKISGLVPADIEVRRNLFHKPLSWNPHHPSYAGKRWSVKNLFELKSAKRVVVDGNIFENNWVDAQSGPSILFTVRNQDCTAPWSTIEDVVFTNNIIRNVAAGVSVLGKDDRANCPSQQLQRLRIENNLFVGVGAPNLGGNGRLYQVLNGARDVTFRNNTATNTYNVLTFDGEPTTGLVFENNIALHNEYGVMGSGQSPGMSTLNHYAPGGRFAGNVLVGGVARLYPTGNFFPSSLAEVGFIDLANGNYGIRETSPYKGKGADVARIHAAIGGQVVPTPPPTPPPTPDPPKPPEPPAPSPTLVVETTAVPVIGQEAAVVTFTLSTAARARIEYSKDSSFSSQSAAQPSAISHTIILTSLTYDTVYNYRIVAVDSAGKESRSRTYTFRTCRMCR